MRDPDVPRGNPLFDASDSGTRPPRLRPVEEPGGEAEGAPTGAEDETGTEGEACLDAGALVEALVEAGPEAAEHVLAAMHELVLAAETVVAAAERGVQGRGGRERPRRESAPEPDRSPRVRPVDLD